MLGGVLPLKPLKKTEIQITHRNDAVLLDLTWDALVAAQEGERGPWIFRYGDTLAEVRGGRVRVLTDVQMGILASRAIDFVKPGRDHPILTGIPARLERQLVAFPDPRLPRLDRVTSVPLLAPDGSIRTEPGYDPQTRTWLAPRVALPIPLPSTPTTEQVERSKAWIDAELLGDFPFEGEADRANAAGMLLLPFLRALVEGPTPLHIITKPDVGAGATTLARAVLAPGIGEELGATDAHVGNDELDKVLLSLARNGAEYVFLDNLVRLTSAPALAAALTSGVVRGRLLGRSDMIEVPFTPVWVATGNNPTLTDEFRRRAQHVRLVPTIQRGWKRKWRRPNLVGWALGEGRGQLAWACLCLCRAWLAGGGLLWPGADETGFPSWAGIVGGVVEGSGWPGFMGNAETYLEADVDDADEAWGELLAAWEVKFGQAWFAPSQAYDVALSSGLINRVVWGRRDPRVSLGMTMKHRRDKIQGGRKLVQAGTRTGGTNHWQVERV